MYGTQIQHSLSFCCMNISIVAQWSLTFRNPMDCPPLSSVHGIFQARILEWVSISYSRRSLPKSRDSIHISCISSIGRWILYHCAAWEARNYKFYWTSTQKACHIIHHPQKQVTEQQGNVTNKKQFSVVDSNFYAVMNSSSQ